MLRVLVQIWQGGASVMKDEEWFAEHRITHIVSLGDRTPDPSILATRKHLHYDVDGATSSRDEAR